MSKPIVWIDMDDVLCDYSGHYAECVYKYPELEFQQSREGYFLELEPVPGAVEAFKWLSEHFDARILTAPSVFNPHSYTEKRKWVEEHLGFEACRKLTLAPDKSVAKGHYLIDDNTDTNGQRDFEGQLILFGSDIYPDWERVISHMKRALKDTQPREPIKMVGRAMVFGMETSGGRVYTKDMVEGAIDNIIDKVEVGQALGECGPVNREVIDLAAVSHSIDDVYVDSSGVNVELTILETPGGNRLREMIDNEVGLSVGCRATGTVDSEGNIENLTEVISFDIIPADDSPYGRATRLKLK